MIENIAVIILNYNDASKTQKCINSFFNAGIYSSQIYLIDNNSSQPESRNLFQNYPQINFFQLSENNGYAYGNNFGIKKALSDGFKYFLISNNDIVISGNTLKILYNEISSSKENGLVTCKVLYKDFPDKINAAGGRFNKILCTGENLNIGENNQEIIEKKEIDFVPGMIFLMRKEVIDKIGLMREDFFMYFEDLEYSFRVNKFFKMIYTSESSVLHDSGGGIRGKNYSSLYLYYYTRNRLKLFKSYNKFYYFYVIFFSIISFFHKSTVILRNNDKREIKKNKLIHLFNGLKDGLIK